MFLRCITSVAVLMLIVSSTAHAWQINAYTFDDAGDLAEYPRPIGDDLSACREAHADLVFLPEVEAMYPEGFGTWVTVDDKSTILEGASREGHFRGVATIVHGASWPK